MSQHDIFKNINWKQIKERSHEGMKLNSSLAI